MIGGLRFSSVLAGCAVVALVVTTTGTLHAQRGGRGGGSGGGEAAAFQLTRLETLTADFKLNKDQKKSIKDLLDEAYKAAAPARDALITSHAAIGAAVAAGKSQPEIDAAVKEYGHQAAVMAALEMKALAQVLQQLDPEQRANQPAVRSAFFLMRGVFLDAKRWDKVPD